VSKKHGAKRKHRRKARKTVLCASCGKPPGGWSLLAGLAAALNACADAGVKVRMRHYGLETGRGYVLRLPDGHWGARTADYTTYPEALGDDDGMDA
jgi:hypothetical protein